MICIEIINLYLYVNRLPVDAPGTKVKTAIANNTAIRGRSIKLECVVDSSPPPTSVIWIHSGQPVRLDHSMELTPDNLVLTFTSLSTHHDGEYTCIATNTYGAGPCVEAYTMNVLCKFFLFH